MVLVDRHPDVETSTDVCSAPASTAFARHVEELKRHRRPVADNLVLVSRVGSTHQLARRIAAECLEQNGTVPSALLVAYEQTAGRGRLGNRWASPAGLGIYATLLWPGARTEELATLPLRLAVALARALDRWLGDGSCRLRWPNDLLVGDHKIGGLLIEALVRGEQVRAALIGFGVNHGQARAQLPTRGATSLRLEAAQPPSLAVATWELAAAVTGALEPPGGGQGAIESYRRRSIHREGERLRCRLPQGVVEGIFRGFDTNGRLRLQRGGEELLLAAGEVVTP